MVLPSSALRNFAVATCASHPEFMATQQPCGSGPLAAIIAQRFRTATRRLGLDTPSLPLNVAFPAEALPGCNLHVTPDGIDSVFAPLGVATTQLPLPNGPPLVGVTFYHQVVVVVVDPQFQVLEVSSSNALVLTIGN